MHACVLRIPSFSGKLDGLQANFRPTTVAFSPQMDKFLFSSSLEQVHPFGLLGGEWRRKGLRPGGVSFSRVEPERRGVGNRQACRPRPLQFFILFFCVRERERANVEGEEEGSVGRPGGGGKGSKVGRRRGEGKQGGSSQGERQVGVGRLGSLFLQRMDLGSGGREGRREGEREREIKEKY